eukprot:289586_1
MYSLSLYSANNGDMIILLLAVLAPSNRKCDFIGETSTFLTSLKLPRFEATTVCCEWRIKLMFKNIQLYLIPQVYINWRAMRLTNNCVRSTPCVPLFMMKEERYLVIYY